jgi:hypothetical protein
MAFIWTYDCFVAPLALLAMTMGKDLTQPFDMCRDRSFD